jgi:hypothetical protein
MMFEQSNGEAMENAESSHDTQDGATQHAGASRIIPAVRFGLRAAVLAGVIASVGGATTGMGGALNALAGQPDTTCCGGHVSNSQTV